MCAKSVRGILYADDAGIDCKSGEDLAKMVTVVVAFFESVGLTVSETETETTMLRTLRQVLPTSQLVVEAAGQRYIYTMQFLCLSVLLDANTDITQDIKRRI